MHMHTHSRSNKPEHSPRLLAWAAGAAAAVAPAAGRLYRPACLRLGVQGPDPLHRHCHCHQSQAGGHVSAAAGGHPGVEQDASCRTG